MLCSSAQGIGQEFAHPIAGGAHGIALFGLYEGESHYLCHLYVGRVVFQAVDRIVPAHQCIVHFHVHEVAPCSCGKGVCHAFSAVAHWQQCGSYAIAVFCCSVFHALFDGFGSFGSGEATFEGIGGDDDVQHFPVFHLYETFFKQRYKFSSQPHVKKEENLPADCDFCFSEKVFAGFLLYLHQ